MNEEMTRKFNQITVSHTNHRLEPKLTWRIDGGRGNFPHSTKVETFPGSARFLESSNIPIGREMFNVLLAPRFPRLLRLAIAMPERFPLPHSIARLRRLFSMIRNANTNNTVALSQDLDF